MKAISSDKELQYEIYATQEIEQKNQAKSSKINIAFIYSFLQKNNSTPRQRETTGREMMRSKTVAKMNRMNFSQQERFFTPFAFLTGFL